MTALLDPHATDRLVKLLGMLGSAHAGERANAAEAADRLVRGAGLTWRDIIKGDDQEPETVEAMVGMAMAYPEALTDWERGFVRSIAGRRNISPKQRGVLEGIVARIRAYEGRAA